MLNEDTLMDRRTINEHYAEVAREIIKKEPELSYIRDSQVSIVYLSSEHAKKHNGRTIFGQCEKVAEKYKWGIPCDFTITIFEPNIEGFSEKQIMILLFHELLHIVIDANEDGTESYSTRGHDLEDFKLIIDRFGTDWCKRAD